ncbi:MAG: discoidin domain-containing protein, partial [Actinomadura rubrobrunea]|nr:discoidin domain-containing protein [Actinomadura rubrobrunea]
MSVTLTALSLLTAFTVAGATRPASAAACGTANAALNRPATASSVENDAFPASAAVDGNSGTRWSSAFSDPQWIQIDLGSTRSICKVVLNWEAAYARAFQLQVSTDGSTWTPIYTTSSGTGGTQTLDVTGTGRYVRVYGTARGTPYGYSLWEIAVHTTEDDASDPFWGDISTIPPAKNVLMVKILNRTNGRYPDDQVFWSYNGEVHSIAEQPYFDMPVNTAGRMYFHLGSPTSRYSDFIEFTVGPDVFNGNTTRVDGFGLKLAMRLRAHDGYDVSVGEDLSVFQESREATFQRFIDEVPDEFDHLARIEAPYRIPSPGNSSEFRPGGAYADYFTSYAASVGVSATTAEVTGCAGPLAQRPDMCAALNRHVATLPESQWRDPSQFY